MPTYEYKGPDGDIVERYFDMGSAPEAITVDLVTYTRIVSGGARPLVRGTDHPVVGWSLPWKRNMTPEQVAAVEQAGGCFSEKGVPRFDNGRQAEKFCKITQGQMEKAGQGEAWTTGDGPDGMVERLAEDHAQAVPC